MAKFLEKKIHPSNLVKDLLEKHGKHLLWKSHEPAPGTVKFIPQKLEPMRDPNEAS